MWRSATIESVPKKNPQIEARDRRRTEEFLRRLERYRATRPETHRRGWATDVAKAAQVDKSTMSRILNGDRPATADQLLAIAKHLAEPGLLPDEMRAGVGKASKGPSDHDVAYRSGSPTMSVVASSLPPGERRPPGLEEWLAARIGIAWPELVGLERHRARGVPDTVMREPGYWDEVLEDVRQMFAAATGAPGGAPGGKAPNTR